MQRRDFLKGAALCALLAGLPGTLRGAGVSAENETGEPDLVAVRGEDPAAMFDRGIAEFGGIGAFVKRGQKVLIKPNIGWDQPPEMAANTNPDLIRHMVELCLKAGAAEVAVFDNSCDNWVNSYRRSGIRDAVEGAGGVMVSGKQESDYREVEIPGAVKMRRARVHRLVLDSDVFFNVPILKHHGGALLTCAMKNFMGIVWDRGFMHKNDLQQCIADASLIRRPDLNIVDAYRVMRTGGPRGNAGSEIKLMKSLLLSRDIVAVDTAAARLIGFDPAAVGHIGNAERLGLGTTQLDKIQIRKLV